jgi:hypothetical protein
MSSHTMERIGVEMHGVKLNLACNCTALLEYIECLLESHSGPAWESPDLEVNGTWRTDPTPDTSQSHATLELDRLGKRMRVSDDHLVWFNTHRNKHLQLGFRRRGPTLVFDVDYHYRPSAKKLAQYPEYEYRKFFSLLPYLVHFPIAWRLERSRGWCLVHASAVADGDEAVLVAGLGGTGKTTTCVALAARTGMKIVTENLLFSDGDQIFPMWEPLRLTDESLKLLSDGPGELESLGVSGRLRYKSLFRLSTGQTGPIRPAALFIPQFSRSGFVRRIPSEVAAEILGGTNRLALELNDYYWYTAALDLLWPAAGNAERQLHALKRLTAATSCYKLGIDRSHGVAPVVDQILQSLSSSRRPGDPAPPIQRLTNEALLSDSSTGPTPTPRGAEGITRP